MKMKRVFSAALASAIALSGMSAFGASAEVYNAEKTMDVTGNAGVTFQSGNYSFRDLYGTSGDLAVFPQQQAGIKGGGYGYDSKLKCDDAKISGDGTYTVSIATNGTIDTAPDLTKPANKKGWYIDEEKGLTREGSPWSLLGAYEPKKLEEGTELSQETLEWEAQNDVTYFNMLAVCTDIPVTYDKDTHKCYLDEKMTQEVTVSDIIVDMCGTQYTAATGGFKDDIGTLAISLINVYDSTGAGSCISESAYPTQNGTITVTFTVKGLTQKTSTDLSKEGKVTLSKSKAAYTGKAIKPGVTVKVGSTKLKKGTDYTVAYKNNKKTGKATVTVTGKGNYTGKLSKAFYIVPKKPGKPSVTATCCGKVTVKLKKDKTATGYKIRYSTDKSFKKGVKTVTITKNSTTTKEIKKLKAAKKYYFQSASYIKVGSKKYFGAYSATKAVIVK